jgi:2-C-methyl-D-erythritol 4-phosphate cytidylyltransferase
LGRRKQLLELSGRPVVAWSLATLAECALVDEIVVACEPDEIDACERAARECCGDKLRDVVAGGERRQDSVYAALRAADPASDIVLVHDGARPFVDEATIRRVIAAAQSFGAAVPCVPLQDTIKEIAGDTIVRTHSRERLRAAQTPQGFSFSILTDACAAAARDGFAATDEAALVEKYGSTQVHVVEGSPDNVKITTPFDLAIAENIARRMARTP